MYWCIYSTRNKNYGFVWLFNNSLLIIRRFNWFNSVINLVLKMYTPNKYNISYLCTSTSIIKLKILVIFEKSKMSYLLCMFSWDWQISNWKRNNFTLLSKHLLYSILSQLENIIFLLTKHCNEFFPCLNHFSTFWVPNCITIIPIK